MDANALLKIDPPLLLRDAAAKAIRKAILEGRLRPGAKLSEQQIAEQLGMSRLPVREAIRELEQHGLVHSRPRSGTYVADPTPKDLETGCRFRAALEEFAIQEALRLLDAAAWTALCDQLLTVIDRMRAFREADNWVDGIDLESHWHGSIVEATGNSWLIQTWHNLGLPSRFNDLKMVWSGTNAAGRWQEIAEDHQDLLEVLRQADEVACRAAIRKHVLRNVPGLEDMVINGVVETIADV